MLTQSLDVKRQQWDLEVSRTNHLLGRFAA